MSELEDKLNALLSDPDTMAQITRLAGSLGGSGGADSPPERPVGENTSDALSGLTQLLGGLDPGLLSRILPALREVNRPESSETTAFLHALRPFLRPERQEKVERAAQLAKLVHLAKVFFTEGGGNV